MTLRLRAGILAFALLPAAALGHGDVAPQPVDTGSLPEVGEEWLDENPYRSMGPEVLAEAVRVGASGYNQNCARCHGLEAISGGLAPDLRYLSADWDGDEWFVERFRHGYTQNGITKMPAFGELLGQKAAWAIRTYIETRPDDGALDDHADRLKQIRDELAARRRDGRRRRGRGRGAARGDAGDRRAGADRLGRRIRGLGGHPRGGRAGRRPRRRAKGGGDPHRRPFGRPLNPPGGPDPAGPPPSDRSRHRGRH